MSYAQKYLMWDEFVEYFLNGDKKKAKKYEEHKDGDEEYGYIYIDYKGSDEKDDLPYMCNILWREPNGEWKKMRFNGSSPFAYWFGSNDDIIDDCDDCKVSNFNEGGCDCQMVKCCGCEEEDHKYNHTLKEGKLYCDSCSGEE